MMNPILVGGDGRGGTTMLATMLDAHPEILCGPEIHLRSVDDIGSDYWARRASRMGWSKEQIGERLGRWNHPIKRFPDRCKFLESLLVEKMHEKGKSRWGFKIMRGISIANFYDKVWPSALFVHIIRDGRDVALSNFNFKWGYSDIEGAAAGWKGNIEKARKTAPKGRYYEVKYESIVRAPRYEMKKLSEWLGVKFNYETVTPYKEGREQAFYTTPVNHPSYKGLIEGIQAKYIDRWKEGLTTDQINQFQKIAGSMLKEIGYDLH
jgi:hypothetical protein